MEFKKLLKFIENESERLKKCYSYPDNEKVIFARTIKLNEEVGELNSEVLTYHSLQRKEKLERYNKESFSEEFADVIITALLLANSMNIDIEKALENKIKKINKRYKKI
jgi:NTP pyrophosphatase (non-canonical NTP hydrolase)